MSEGALRHEYTFIWVFPSTLKTSRVCTESHRSFYQPLTRGHQLQSSSSCAVEVQQTWQFCCCSNSAAGTWNLFLFIFFLLRIKVMLEANATPVKAPDHAVRRHEPDFNEVCTYNSKINGTERCRKMWWNTNMHIEADMFAGPHE